MRHGEKLVPSKNMTARDMSAAGANTEVELGTVPDLNVKNYSTYFYIMLLCTSNLVRLAGRPI